MRRKIIIIIFVNGRTMYIIIKIAATEAKGKFRSDVKYKKIENIMINR